MLVTEKPDSPVISGGGKGRRVERRYVCWKTTDETAARLAVLSVAPVIDSTSGETLVRQAPNLEKQPKALDVWDVTVPYEKLTCDPVSAGQPRYSFDATGGTQRIYQSIATQAYAAPGKTAPDFQGAIGVTKDSVEGVDIHVPGFSWTETWPIPAAMISTAYLRLLSELKGHWNNAPWRGWYAGEVLFLGATGDYTPPSGQQSQDAFEMAFRFAAEANRTGLTVGDITGIAKRGWDYLWVLYEEREDATAKWLVKRPRAVYVEQVYDPANFGLLGI